MASLESEEVEETMAQMSRDELVQLVGKILTCSGNESEVDGWLRLFAENVPHPQATDRIYFTDKARTAEEIVNEALSYKKIQL